MAGEDYVQRILIQGDANPAIQAFGSLRRAMQEYQTEAEKIVDTGDQIGMVMGAMTRSILGLGTVGVAAAAAADSAARSFSVTERGMERIAFETGKARAELGNLKDQFWDLSAKTGEPIDLITEKFRNFTIQTGLSGDIAIKTFKDIALAADLAGVSTEHMTKIAIAAAKSPIRLPLTLLTGVMLRTSRTRSPMY